MEVFWTLSPALLEKGGHDSSPLPRERGPAFYRYLRWNFGSVYRRIFSIVYFSNMAVLVALLARSAMPGEQPKLTYQQASIAAMANIPAAFLVRNEHVVNAMFWVLGTWTKNLSLRLRILAANVHSYGGIHSGGAVSATSWHICFLVLLTMEFGSAPSLSVVRGCIYFVGYFILFLLVSMLISAYPHFRRVMHNWFEGIHRFAGWLAVLLFWAQVMLLTSDATQASGVPFGRALVVSPNFWMLIAITLLVIYPWTLLHLRPVESEVLSSHCLKLTFRYRNGVHYGQAIRLTDAPLKETHAFGVIPFPSTSQTNPYKHDLIPQDEKLEQSQATIKHDTLTTPTKGFSVLISNAGDWTRTLITHPPSHIYTRGTPPFGVLRIAGLFKPCILVATGSGIAPCLSLLVSKPEHPVRIVWATRDPVKTYGNEVVEMVYRADPEAVVVDTGVEGRPDLVRVAYRVWEEGRVIAGEAGRQRKRVEAVVVISTQGVTKEVVYGLECRGVPAYGAIFDS
jgi:hypothetical protein